MFDARSAAFLVVNTVYSKKFYATVSIYHSKMSQELCSKAATILTYVW